jgi:hypothetical protein
MPKGLAVGRAALELGDLAQDLAQSDHPKELLAAGWAAVESAVMSRGERSKRIQMMHWGVTLWESSHATQMLLLDTDSPNRVNKSEPLRTRRAIAAAPIFEGIIRGKLGEGGLRKSFTETMKIAEESIELHKTAEETDRIDDRRYYAGFNSELLVQLLDDFTLRPDKVTVPAPLRADNGWYNRSATHDLVTLHLTPSGINEAMPTEVKGIPNSHYIARYRALVVTTGRRGLLYITGSATPVSERIAAIKSLYKGTLTAKQAIQIRTMEDNLSKHRLRYANADPLLRLSPPGSVTQFHDMHGQG